MSIAIINVSASNVSPNGLEALDLAFSFANLEQDVSMFFIDDGVFQLVKNQQPESHGYKNHTKSYPAMAFYDIENIYVCKNSLEQRNLALNDLCIDIALFEKHSLSPLLRNYKHVVTL
ncbi:sulfurtransferase complex subunit TusC [Alteromonas sp. a30]|uniref:sulfurtransferase complex subunit TusC n=1 Tax=Alteromonas sp. a30 TaxID=2730917 RepID=UPI00227F2DE9|nr:sulfurtransferase complex subunit TusC [Alteromonas sp. a30]MCY7295120.1 sulfurtransferase complex subunit TusC [Alteromonas sp. a30]